MNVLMFGAKTQILGRQKQTPIVRLRYMRLTLAADPLPNDGGDLRNHIS
jgi:hypothetical protein